MKMKKILIGLSTEELKLLAVELGEKGFRGKQVADWIYRQKCAEIGQMANLSAAFKERLAADYEIGRSRLIRQSSAPDGTFKLLLKPAYGEAIETVGLPYKDRFSCCVSTQVGCPVSCAFCATGASGFKRNLSAGEIVDQVLTVEAFAANKNKSGDPVRVTHVVFMGMGEPLLNYDATLAAVHLLNSELNIGMRNITISTVGYVPGIYKLAKENLQITLAVSLHASDDITRRKLVLGMSRYSVHEIIEACRDYFRETHRRLSIEYCLLKGVNDSKSDAEGLVVLLKKLHCHVNLIPYNDAGFSNFQAPESAAVNNFRLILEEANMAVTQREQRGAGIEAACGQLRRQHSGVANDFFK
jgi:23S rRNA (adenine2503-C2)-methyltransferase